MYQWPFLPFSYLLHVLKYTIRGYIFSLLQICAFWQQMYKHNWDCHDAEPGESPRELVAIIVFSFQSRKKKQTKLIYTSPRTLLPQEWKPSLRSAPNPHAQNRWVGILTGNEQFSILIVICAFQFPPAQIHLQLQALLSSFPLPEETLNTKESTHLLLFWKLFVWDLQ